MYIDPVVVYEAIPQLAACSKELLVAGYDHKMICDITTTVLHCYAQLQGLAATGCDILIIQGPYNRI